MTHEADCHQGAAGVGIRVGRSGHYEAGHGEKKGHDEAHRAQTAGENRGHGTKKEGRKTRALPRSSAHTDPWREIIPGKA